MLIQKETFTESTKSNDISKCKVERKIFPIILFESLFLFCFAFFFFSSISVVDNFYLKYEEDI